MLSVLQFRPSLLGLSRYLSPVPPSSVCKDVLLKFLKLRVGDQVPIVYSSWLRNLEEKQPSDVATTNMVVMTLKHNENDGTYVIHSTNVDELFPDVTTMESVISLYEFGDQVHFLNHHLIQIQGKGVHFVSVVSGGKDNMELCSTIEYQNLILTSEKLLRQMSKTVKIEQTLINDDLSEDSITVRFCIRVKGLDNCLSYIHPTEGMFAKILNFFRMNLYIDGYRVPQGIGLTPNTCTPTNLHPLFCTETPLVISEQIILQLEKTNTVRMLVSKVSMMYFNKQVLFQEYVPDVVRAIVIESNEIKRQKGIFAGFIPLLSRKYLRDIYQLVTETTGPVVMTCEQLRQYFTDLVSTTAPSLTLDYNTWLSLCDLARQSHHSQLQTQFQTSTNKKPVITVASNNNKRPRLVFGNLS